MSFPKTTFEEMPSQGAHGRAFLLEKIDGTFGFTTVTCCFMDKKKKVLKTLIDTIENQGPAALAGLQEGDEILSVNGVFGYDTLRSQGALVRAIESGSRVLVVIKNENRLQKMDPQTVEDTKEGPKDNTFVIKKFQRDPKTTDEDTQEIHKKDNTVIKKKSNLDIFRRRPQPRVGAPTTPKYIKTMHYSPVILKKYKKRRSRSVEIEL